MGPDVESVEKLIIQALKDDVAVNAVVKTFDTYDGQFRQDDLEKILGLLPGCFVTFVRDRNVAATKGRTYIQRNQFNVVVASKDMRKGVARSGALPITDLVHAALHLNTLGLAGVVHGLEREDRFPVLMTDQIAVYEMTFKIEWVD